MAIDLAGAIWKDEGEPFSPVVVYVAPNEAGGHLRERAAKLAAGKDNAWRKNIRIFHTGNFARMHRNFREGAPDVVIIDDLDLMRLSDGEPRKNIWHVSMLGDAVSEMAKTTGAAVIAAGLFPDAAILRELEYRFDAAIQLFQRPHLKGTHFLRSTKNRFGGLEEAMLRKTAGGFETVES